MKKGLPKIGRRRMRAIDRNIVGGLFDKRLCSKCGKNQVYQPDIPTMDLCESCIWALVKDDIPA